MFPRNDIFILNNNKRRIFNNYMPLSYSNKCFFCLLVFSSIRLYSLCASLCLMDSGCVWLIFLLILDDFIHIHCLGQDWVSLVPLESAASLLHPMPMPSCCCGPMIFPRIYKFSNVENSIVFLVFFFDSYMLDFYCGIIRVASFSE